MNYNMWEATSDDEEMENEYTHDAVYYDKPPELEEWRSQPPPNPKEIEVEVPKTDKGALDTLLKIAGDRWVVVSDDSMYIYSNKCNLWFTGEARFYELCMENEKQLGLYGSMTHKMRQLLCLAKSKNGESVEWMQGLDRLPSGEVPFIDGIYNVVYGSIRPITKYDKLTTTFEISSPASHEQYTYERERVEQLIDNLLPEPRLKLEVMTRLAESFFTSRNNHKYFVQLYGEGNNGKTTLMRILQTAFPKWVMMPNVENLLARNRNPDGPQPWLVQVKTARILGLEEPPKGAKFDASLLKLLRGNGVVTGRGLYKDLVSYVPSFTLWIATNSLVEIDLVDQAIQNSLHSFNLPSYFIGKGEVPPLGTQFVKEKITNLEEQFCERSYQMALFAILGDYYKLYLRDQCLPSLESPFSKPITDVYHEDHSPIEEIFKACVTEDANSEVTLQKLHHIMKINGYVDGDKKLNLFIQNRFKKHKFVKKKKPKNTTIWSGLHVEDPTSSNF